MTTKKVSFKEFKKFDILSLAKIQALIMVVVGLLLGLVYGIIGLLSGQPMLLVMIPLLPLIYGFFGFVGGAIGAWVYNAVAKKIGGIKVLIE